MTIAFNVSRSIPAKVDAVGIPVASDGPIPASVGLSRAALKSIGFEGARTNTCARTRWPFECSPYFDRSR